MIRRDQIFKVERAKDTDVKVVFDIRPESALPSQKAAWQKFWLKIIPEVKADER